MSLEDNIELDILIVDVDHTHDTRVVADCGNTTAIVVGTADQVDAASVTVELLLSDCLTGDVIPELDVSILADGYAHVTTITDGHVVNAT